MSNLRQPLVVFGGTFNPVHYGHLRLAEDIHNLFPEAEIRLMPCATPPHRIAPKVSASDRLTMLQLATRDYAHLTVDPREINRSGTSYTWLSVSEIEQEEPERPLYLVMGDDAFAGLATWYEWQSLLGRVNIIIVARRGESSNLREISSTWPIIWHDSIHALKLQAGGGVFRYETPLLDISSSYIREQIEHRHSCRFLLPDVVLEYISANGLYITQGK